jgi:hypothetical protein
VETFKVSINAFSRTAPPRLPGKPLPGIRVKQPVTGPRLVHLENIFGEPDDRKKGYKIQVCDATVFEKPTSINNIGIATRYAGGAQTDVTTKTIWVHESVISACGVSRKWGSTLNVKQVTAHELGHAVNGGGL